MSVEADRSVEPRKLLSDVRQYATAAAVAQHLYSEALGSQGSGAATTMELQRRGTEINLILELACIKATTRSSADAEEVNEARRQGRERAEHLLNRRPSVQPARSPRLNP